MFLLIDNYDSFTYNLYHYLGQLGAELVVRRNDALSAADALAMKPQGIVLSPGPCDPDRAGICLDLIHAAASARVPVPLLGVCLGHQAIGQAFGGRIARAAPMHGKLSRVKHTGRGIFEGIPSPFTATRYHSLVVKRDTVPACLEVTAETRPEQEIMGLRHREFPIWGVQFHPESVLTTEGKKLLKNFLTL